jgi:hypothetical protein
LSTLNAPFLAAAVSFASPGTGYLPRPSGASCVSGLGCNNNLVSTKILMKAIITSAKTPAVSEPEEDTEVDVAAD